MERSSSEDCYRFHGTSSLFEAKPKVLCPNQYCVVREEVEALEEARSFGLNLSFRLILPFAEEWPRVLSPKNPAWVGEEVRDLNCRS